MWAMNTNDDLTFTQAAAALGIKPPAFTVLMQRKGIAGRKSPDHRNAKLISRAELETAIGYRLTDAQVASTMAKAKPAKQLPTYDDPGLVNLGYEIADDNWQRHMLALGLDHVSPPKRDGAMELVFANRNTVTRSEVYTLLEAAVKQRDRMWHEWVNDSVARAQFPYGPTTLDFKYPDPEE